MFRERCYNAGVTDPADVKNLWAEERARIKAAQKKSGGGRKRDRQ